MSCPAVGASRPSWPQPVIRPYTSRGLRSEALVGAEPEPLRHPWPVALDEGVGPLDQPQHDLPPVGCLRSTAIERRPRCMAYARALRTRPAGPVDPHDVGAEVGQQHRGERTGPEPGQLDHAWRRPAARPSRLLLREAEHPLAEDVALDLVGAAVDRLGPGVEEAVLHRRPAAVARAATRASAPSTSIISSPKSRCQLAQYSLPIEDSGAGMAALQHGAQQPVVVELQDPQTAPRPGQRAAARPDRRRGRGVRTSSMQLLASPARTSPGTAAPSCRPLVAERAHHHPPPAVHVADDVVGAVRASSKNTSQNSWPPAMLRIGRTSTPCWWRGTSSIEMPRCFGASGLVRHSTYSQSAWAPNVIQIFWPLIDPLVAVPLGAGLQAGEVGAGVGLAEALPPQLLAAGDRRAGTALLLVAAELEQRRAEQVAALHADPVRRLGRGVLDVEDQLLASRCRRGRRTPRATRR